MKRIKKIIENCRYAETDEYNDELLADKIEKYILQILKQIRRKLENSDSYYESLTIVDKEISKLKQENKK